MKILIHTVPNYSLNYFLFILSVSKDHFVEHLSVIQKCESPRLSCKRADPEKADVWENRMMHEHTGTWEYSLSQNFTVFEMFYSMRLILNISVKKIQLL